MQRPGLSACYSRSLTRIRAIMRHLKPQAMQDNNISTSDCFRTEISPLGLYKDALVKSQQAFREASLYETYSYLGLQDILSAPKTVEYVAGILHLNLDATSRFLHALAHLGLIRKRFDNKYIINNSSRHYTNKSSLTLIKIINLQIPDYLDKTPLTFDELHAINNKIEISLLEDAVSYLLLLKNEREQFLIPPETRKLMVSSSRDYIGTLVKYYEEIAIPMSSREALLGALRTGKNQWSTLFGEDVKELFDLYASKPNELKLFTSAIHKMNEEDNKILLSQLQPDEIETVLDVGGGSGSVAIEILKQIRNIRRIDIYELPNAIPLMRSICNEYAPDENRIAYIAGSFMDETVSGLSGLPTTNTYDLITLAWILHDWSDETNLKILKKVYSHLKPNGRILIIEGILPENRVSKLSIADITMLLNTYGRERTFVEYKNLLEASGFVNIKCNFTDTRRQAIFGYKI